MSKKKVEEIDEVLGGRIKVSLPDDARKVLDERAKSVGIAPATLARSYLLRDLGFIDKVPA